MSKPMILKALKNKPFTARLPLELEFQLMAYCKATARSKNQIIRILVEKFMQNPAKFLKV